VTGAVAEGAFDDARREAAAAIAGGSQLRQLDDFDGAGAVGQAADEAALLQCRNEAVDSGFRTQVERVLHLVEGGRYAGFFQPFIDETQKFILFARKHLEQSPGWRRLSVPNRQGPSRKSPKLPTIDTSSRNKS